MPHDRTTGTTRPTRTPRTAGRRTARLAALAVLTVLPLLGSVLPSALGPAAAPPAEAQAQGMFKVVCLYSHTLADDPIVFPGRPGASHRHDFFGATRTDADSTLSTLQRSPTTCRNAADRSAYWAPQLSVRGKVVQPVAAQAYYRASNRDPRKIRPYPVGLKMVAGDPTAQGPQSVDVAGWTCSSGGTPHFQAILEQCQPGEKLRNRIRFPECWDGKHVDSADHRSHVAYLVKGSCPGSHPVALPRLDIEVHYGYVTGVPPSAVTLASGAWWTAHADFINAWEPAAQSTFVSRCLNGTRICNEV